MFHICLREPTSLEDVLTHRCLRSPITRAPGRAHLHSARHARELGKCGAALELDEVVAQGFAHPFRILLVSALHWWVPHELPWLNMHTVAEEAISGDSRSSPEAPRAAETAHMT